MAAPHENLHYQITLAALSMAANFPTLKSGLSQLKFHVKLLQSLNASMDFSSDRIKSNSRAQELRNSGNFLFTSNGDLETVAEMYTKCLAYAVPGSPEVALAYANRSAVSFTAGEYEASLLDIERSLENDYPEKTRAKLYARKVRCLVALKKPQVDIDKALEDTREALMKMDPKASGRDFIEKVLHDEKHMAPPASNDPKVEAVRPTIQDDSCEIPGATGIAIQYSEQYGRHIVATRDHRPGQVIAVIDSYALVRCPDNCYRECSYCSRQTSCGIPCKWCVNVVYCSSDCRSKAWQDYHEFECPILGFLLNANVSTSGILALRMTLKAVREAGGVSELKEMLAKIDAVSDPRRKGFTGNVFDCSKYASVGTLISHAGNHGLADQSFTSGMTTCTVYLLAVMTEILGEKCEESLEVFNSKPQLLFLGEVMLRNWMIVLMTGQGKTRLSKDQNYDVGVCPFSGLCNHSCNLNTMVLSDTTNVVVALQPIKAGEQLYDCYQGQYYHRVSRVQRQASLKDHYFFTCKCVACTEDWPTFEALPEATDIPGMSKATRKLIMDAEIALMKKVEACSGKIGFRGELVELLELLHEHARPSKAIIRYQNLLHDRVCRDLSEFLI